MVKCIRCGSVNCYLLAGNGGSILIDAGNHSDISTIYRVIKDEDIRLILLTHGHPDHTGAAAGLARRLHAPVAMSKEDGVLLEHPAARKLYAHTRLGKVLTLATKMNLRTKAEVLPTPSIWLEDGRELLEYGAAARVVALPGHTKGSIGVLTDTGDFIVGDAMFNIFRPTGALLYEDKEQMERSIGIIARSGAKILHVGHGKPVTMEKIHSFG